MDLIIRDGKKDFLVMRNVDKCAITDEEIGLVVADEIAAANERKINRAVRTAKGVTKKLAKHYS